MTSHAEKKAARLQLDADQAVRFPEARAASLRGPFVDETRNIPIPNTSTLFHVPDGDEAAGGRGSPKWNGRIVRMRAIGGDVYLVFGTASVTVDEAAESATSSVEIDGETALKITGHATNQECWRVLEADGWVDVDVRPEWTIMAAKGSVACHLLTHPSES